MLEIYNSFTQKKEIFLPIEEKKIKIYVCGITVYDYCHLGHARTYVAFDMIIRYLRWCGYDVTHVQNITDIDDKIINRANAMNEPFQVVVDRFIQAAKEDFSALGLLTPDHSPRATEHIQQIIALIKTLLEKNAAYVGENGDIYYDVRQFTNYGCLAHRDIDQLQSGARVEISDVKRDPLDFVLWKLAKPGEPHWESPWGSGRPGWHIECSAMSMDLLGERVDIHGGGKDLIFPHHENEIAQSESATHQKFVNTWMHTGYLEIKKQKMSKSLGNFLTIRDLLQQYSPENVRCFLLMSHYRSPIHYSDEILQNTHQSLERLYIALRGLPEAEPVRDSEFEKKFIAAMNDDFNTPVAFSILFDLAHEINRVRETHLSRAAGQGALLKKLGGVLGLLQENPETFFQANVKEVDAKKIEHLITARNRARTEKNWAEADRIRDELIAMSIVLEDGASGTTWKVSY